MSCVVVSTRYSERLCRAASDLLVSESGPSSEVPSGDELHRPATVSSKTRLAAPKWKKKKYLTAGLFSDYYKMAR